MDNILFLFHHIHHDQGGVHSVHHCGGEHVKIDSKVDYEISHCPCGKHSINKNVAIGHAVGPNLESIELEIKFQEKCPDGGWHIEGKNYEIL